MKQLNKVSEYMSITDIRLIALTVTDNLGNVNNVLIVADMHSKSADDKSPLTHKDSSHGWPLSSTKSSRASSVTDITMVEARSEHDEIPAVSSMSDGGNLIPTPEDAVHRGRQSHRHMRLLIQY